MRIVPPEAVQRKSRAESVQFDLMHRPTTEARTGANVLNTGESENTPLPRVHEISAKTASSSVAP